MAAFLHMGEKQRWKTAIHETRARQCQNTTSLDVNELAKAVLALTRPYEYLALGAALALRKSYGDGNAV
jgi:hypothetical protein